MRMSRRMAIHSSVSRETLKYYGTAANLRVARTSLVGASNASYAFFAGAYTTHFGEVDAYDASLTHINPAASDLTWRPSAHCGNDAYVLFCDNWNVTAYDASAVKSTLDIFSTARYDAGGAVIGEYLLVAGGYFYPTNSTSSRKTTAVNAYDKSLTLSQAEALFTGRSEISVANSPTHAIFSGGRTDSSSSYDGTQDVDYYDASLTHSYDTNVPTKTLGDDGHATIGSCAVIWNYADFLICDASRTWTYIGTKSARWRKDSAGTGVDDMMLVVGGYGTDNSKGCAYVDMLDSDFTHLIKPNIPGQRRCLAGAAIGKFALFAGGEYYSTDNVFSDVYVFKSNKKETVQ